MKRHISSLKNRAALWLWLLELLLLMLAVAAAAWLRFMQDSDSYLFFVGTAPIRILVVAVFITTAMAAFGLYQVHVRHNRMDFFLRLLLSFAFGGIGLLVLYYLVPSAYIGRGVLALALMLGWVVVFLLRLAMQHLGHSEKFRRRVLVLGAGQNADLINSRLRRRSDRRSFSLVGFVAVPGQPVLVPNALSLEPGVGLADLAQRLQVHEIVVALDERRGGLPMEAMLECIQRGIDMTDLSTFFEREAGVVSLSIADPSWLVFSGGFDHSMPRRLSKRLFDLVAASALLLVAWPAMVVVAACVWWESGLPILYRQTRVGEDGRSFELVKFRSMRNDAEKDGVARWAAADDDRSTRVGRFIRMTRLDELPQLFNVLRGEMSFVGPRPERPQFVDVLSQDIRYYSVRHCMKPGLTGWAQLRYPYGASVRDAEEKLKFDLFYVKNHGLLFDLMILLQTVEVVLFRRGAR
jgi:sugar transferase (PEP-CTERM system associated)